jgi:hypothetical protein
VEPKLVLDYWLSSVTQLSVKLSRARSKGSPNAMRKKKPFHRPAVVERRNDERDRVDNKRFERELRTTVIESNVGRVRKEILECWPSREKKKKKQREVSVNR